MIRTPIRLCALFLLAGACTDLATGVDAFQLEADGDLWTAIAPPADLPDAASWLRYADRSLSGVHAAAQVAAFQADASRALVRGDLAGADSALARAAQVAVGAVGGEIEPGVFLSGIASLEGWENRVRAGVQLERSPALAAAVERVAADREEVSEAMRAGDQTRAALALLRASDRVREWAPQGVALRALLRVEAQIAAHAPTGPEAERVAHLVRSAREELMSGNQLRAVKRALYALQLAGGAQIAELPPGDRSRCGEYGC